jgi:hypothetical protein
VVATVNELKHLATELPWQAPTAPAATSSSRAVPELAGGDAGEAQSCAAAGSFRRVGQPAGGTQWRGGAGSSAASSLICYQRDRWQSARRRAHLLCRSTWMRRI